MSELPKSFEQMLDRIDEIVKRLEGGVGLDEAVELFKEGKSLARECEQKLKDAQEQVNKAMAADGEPS